MRSRASPGAGANRVAQFDAFTTATADDVSELPSGTLGTLSLELGDYYGDGTGFSWIGVRFRSCTIPKGSVISSAFLILNVMSGTGLGGQIKGVKSPNPSIWSSTFKPSAMPLTDAATNISPTGSGSLVLDVAAALTEIVNQEEYVAGQAIAFVGVPGPRNQLTFIDYSDFPGSAPEFHAVYTAPVDPNEQLEFVGSAVGSSTATMPSHQAGDLILAWAYRDGSTNPPILSETAWQAVLAAPTATAQTGRLYKRKATAANHTVGTFSGATSLIVHVYRPKAGYEIDVGASAGASGAGRVVTYPALALQGTNGKSWAAGFGGHRSTNTTLEAAPAGMVNRSTVADTTDEAAGHDTNGRVAAWSGVDQDVGGTSSGWSAVTVEITPTGGPIAPPPSVSPFLGAEFYG